MSGPVKHLYTLRGEQKWRCPMDHRGAAAVGGRGGGDQRSAAEPGLRGESLATDR